MKKYLYINTIGCQMNVYDSEQIANGLKVVTIQNDVFYGKGGSDHC